MLGHLWEVVLRWLENVGNFPNVNGAWRISNWVALSGPEGLEFSNSGRNSSMVWATSGRCFWNGIATFWFSGFSKNEIFMIFVKNWQKKIFQNSFLGTKNLLKCWDIWKVVLRWMENVGNFLNVNGVGEMTNWVALSGLEGLTFFSWLGKIFYCLYPLWAAFLKWYHDFLIFQKCKFTWFSS